MFLQIIAITVAYCKVIGFCLNNYAYFNTDKYPKGAGK